MFARQSANIVKLEVGEESFLSTQASFAGESRALLDGKSEGDSLTLGFNYRYLREYLSVIGGETVRVDFNGELAPVSFTSSEDKDFTHIIMPVKL